MPIQNVVINAVDVQRSVDRYAKLLNAAPGMAIDQRAPRR
jgi:hypothetical protein